MVPEQQVPELLRPTRRASSPQRDRRSTRYRKAAVDFFVAKARRVVSVHAIDCVCVRALKGVPAVEHLRVDLRGMPLAVVLRDHLDRPQPAAQPVVAQPDRPDERLAAAQW